MKILILYCYYETDDARRNLSFFCRHAVTPNRDRKYVIVVNGGVCTVEDQIPRFENVKVMKRANKGHDFGAWAHALRNTQLEQFDYFFLINSTVTGPFLPLYQDAALWPELFIAMLNDRVKLAGITINVFRGDPIVQSMLLATDKIGIDLLLKHGIFTGNDNDATKDAVIYGREVQSSLIVMNAGFALDCLAITHSRRALQPLKRDVSGDIIFPGRYHAGYTIAPFDSCFFKTNRGCSSEALERSMKLADYKRSVAADRCFQDERILRTIDALKRVPSAWKSHLEFAVWLTFRFSPQVVVDLGVDYGASTYAWGASGTSSVIGIDWFKGDEQTGFRDTHGAVQALGDTLIRDCQYANTVRLWKSSFEEAAGIFDGQVDVLHIDGLHTHKAVERDMKAWLPKVSGDGIIVMHGLCVSSDSVAAHFEKLEHSKIRLEHGAGRLLGIASMNKDKIDIIDKEWKRNLRLHGAELRHAWFDNVRIQTVI